MRHRVLPAWFWPAVFVLIWSSGYVVARFGMPHAPPMSFLALRFALSGLCFCLLLTVASALWKQSIQWPRGRDQWFHLAVVGVLMQAGYLGGVWAAVKAGIGAGLAALIVNFQPVLTALWLSKFHGGHVSSRQWSGLGIGFFGLILVMSRKFGAGGEATAFNVTLCVLALLAMTIGALYQKRFLKPCDVRTASVVQMAAGFSVLAPVAFLEAESMCWLLPNGAWNSELIGAMAFSVLVLTLGGSSLLYVLLQSGEAMQVTSLLYLVPPTTAVMAWVLFGEPITAVSVVGMGLVAWGVWWVVRAPPNPRNSTTDR